MSERTGPLSDLRVIELGQLVAGPFCGQMLADFGADVIKVEPPGRGDPLREWGRDGFPLWWSVTARGKRTITANLREPEGQGIVRRLAANADILIENFRPGTLERWGLGFDALAAVPATRFPGGPALRSPLLVLAMTWYALRDRVGM